MPKEPYTALLPLPSAQSHVERAARMIATLVHARELQAILESGLKSLKREGVLTDVPGFAPGRTDAEHRIGGRPAEADKPYESGIVNDPLESARSGKPRATVVGPPGMPGKGSLTGQDSGGTDYSTFPRRLGDVRVERSTSQILNSVGLK